MDATVNRQQHAHFRTHAENLHRTYQPYRTEVKIDGQTYTFNGNPGVDPSTKLQGLPLQQLAEAAIHAAKHKTCPGGCRPDVSYVVQWQA